MKYVSDSVRVWLRLLLAAMILLQLFRVLFFFAYPQFHQAMTMYEVLLGILVGLRFDFATSLIIVTIPCLFLWFPVPERIYRIRTNIVAILSIVSFLFAAGFLWADFHYYEEAGHHLTFEVKGIKGDLGSMTKLLFSEYWFSAILMIAFLVFMVWTLKKQFNPLRKRQSERIVPKHWWGYVPIALLMILIAVFGIRGGFQLKPMRMTNAFQGDNVLSGHLALNGWYTVVTSAFANEATIKELLPDSIAFKETRRMIIGQGDKFLDDKYPMFRQATALSPIYTPEEKPNVVLIVVESLTAMYLKSFGGSVATMPFLDSLASQSVAFTNCYAIGTRSMEGLSAILCSIPNLMGTPFMGSSQEQTKVRGIATILKSQGYSARFTHAAKAGSMNIMQIASLAGYDKFYHQGDFPADNFDGHWGVWDRYVLQRMNKEMDTLHEPFHYATFTISTHTPFITPPEFKRPFPESMEKQQVYNSFANFDVELRRFFEYESKQPRFAKTIYVILGDHTSQVPPEGTDARFRIGCLVYAPGRLPPKVVTMPVSQLDIVPSIIHLCGLPVKHASFGRSMFDPDTLRHVYFTHPGMVGWRDNQRLLINNLERDIRMSDPVIDPLEKTNLLATEPIIADSLRKELYSFYQTAERLLIGNRILPMTFR
ncbi:MAG: sulfatase-like hydrolase/transferase [bacterium]|nr:sulfatase-like hydrolase/transferase [bacterium]